MKNVAPRHQTITVGELCQAIAEGQINATLHNHQWYQLSARDLRRLVRQRQSTLTSANESHRTLANV
jgi:phage FluMu protein gp41